MIVDHEPMGSGGPITIFESGAIMMYLAEKTRKFWPQEPKLKYEVCQWILWQTGNQGPKFSEQGFFRRAAQDSKHGDLSFPLLRFDNEVHRLYGVLNLGLFNKPYLATGQYTIADMISIPGRRSECLGFRARLLSRVITAAYDDELAKWD